MREVGRVTLCVLALCLLALQIQPSTIEVSGGPGTDFEQVFTFVNDGPVPLDVELRPETFSAYLAGAASFSESRFFLLPQETKNVQLRGEVPRVGPELHVLRYEAVVDESVHGSFAIEMPVEGIADLSPGMRVSANDLLEGSSLVVDVDLSNYGNVVAYYDLELVVLEAGEEVGVLSYPVPVQVLPGDEESLSLVYTNFLEPGEYVAEVRAEVNEEIFLDDTSSFSVSLASEDKVISVGDDVVVDIKRYNSRPRVAYTVSQKGEELLSESMVLDADSFTIPTNSLSAGVYEVAVSVTHSQGSDSQEFLLEVRSRAWEASWLGWLVLAAAVIGALFSRDLRLSVRVWWLSLRVRSREKRLNKLVHRAKELEHGL